MALTSDQLEHLSATAVSYTHDMYALFYQDEELAFRELKFRRPHCTDDADGKQTLSRRIADQRHFGTSHPGQKRRR